MLKSNMIDPFLQKYNIKICGSGGIRTHASEETGALNQRLRQLGHATPIHIDFRNGITLLMKSILSCQFSMDRWCMGMHGALKI